MDGIVMTDMMMTVGDGDGEVGCYQQLAVLMVMTEDCMVVGDVSFVIVKVVDSRD